ncbi:MAG: PEP-CTERM sorting domain-containing protein [Deferrisomatales bacterium]
MAQIDFTESNLGGGAWRYDFALVNTSDPVADVEVDLFDVFLTFDPLFTSTDFVVPTGWFADGGAGFFLAFADFGSEILPGARLDSFGFTLDGRLGSPPVFTVHLTNPDPNGDPFTVPAPTLEPIPEPATAVLLASGLLGLAGSARRRRRRRAS